jgi:hypothetical protein
MRLLPEVAELFKTDRPRENPHAPERIYSAEFFVSFVALV